MFSANISGQIKRVVFDNDKDGKDAILKIVIEARKQFTRDGDMPNVYPLVTIFGFDAAYVRDYAGVGHWITAVNCDLDVYRPDDSDEDRLSFKAGKISLLPKTLSEAIDGVVGDEEDDDDDDDRSSRRKKKKRGSEKSKPARGKSRSERRRKSRDDEDEEEEEEKPRRKKRASGKASDGAKKSRGGKKAPRRKKEEEYDEDYDEDYDDDDYDEDDDYFDDED
jgi:hypothetical protein